MTTSLEPDPTSYNEKTRENRLRRMAQRQGLSIFKAPTRDRNAIGYGTWVVIEPQLHLQLLPTYDDRQRLHGGDPGGVSIDELEKWLTNPPSRDEAIRAAKPKRTPIRPDCAVEHCGFVSTSANRVTLCVDCYEELLRRGEPQPNAKTYVIKRTD